MAGSNGEEGSGSHRADLPAGTRVDKYEIVRRLGEGGMATIYLATSAGPGGFAKPCALKLLRPELAERDPIARMLVTEARVAAVLNHPNIVQVFDFGAYEGTARMGGGPSYFMAMEWVDGVSLGSLMSRLMRERRRLPLASAVQVTMHVAEALGYLSEGVEIDGQLASLVHRDVSPSNVLLSASGGVKLTDFGIVKILDAPTHTRVGVVKGKYAYMAPEQLRGEAVDHRADLFSLGVVLFELLTMARLFHRPNVAATIAAVHAARVPPPSSLWPDVPPELDAIVRKLLAKKRDDRYATAAELIHDLTPFASTSGRSELAHEVRALMSLERSAGPQRALSAPAPEVSQEVPSLSAAEFEDLEELEDEHEQRNSRPPQPSPLPVARPSTRPMVVARAPLARIPSGETTAPPTSRASIPPTPFASLPPHPQPSLPPRPIAPMHSPMPGYGPLTDHGPLPSPAPLSPMSSTMPPSTTSFGLARAPSALPAVIVGAALLATGLFWWFLLS